MVQPRRQTGLPPGRRPSREGDPPAPALRRPPLPHRRHRRLVRVRAPGADRLVVVKIECDTACAAIERHDRLVGMAKRGSLSLSIALAAPGTKGGAQLDLWAP